MNVLRQCCQALVPSACGSSVNVAIDKQQVIEPNTTLHER